jgi:hypothetical protein
VLEGGLHGHGMDELAALHLDHQTIKFKDVTGTGKTRITFDQVPLDKALDYAAEDADVTGRLHRLLKPRLVAEHMVSVYETIERPLIPVLEQMERTGIRVEADQLKRLSDDFAVRLGELQEEIHGLAGRPFNVGSPKQLGEVLFDEMGLPGAKKSGKTGAYVTSADVLEDLAAQGHDLPARVLDWRQLAKLKNTYTDTLVGEINPATGRVHTSYGQTGASTGRLSSSDPNLQNIPVRTEEGRKIRRAFVAEKGWTLLSADYSQIELRLLAHVAGIEALKDAFRDGIDIHALTASQVFGVPVEGMDPMVRRQAKAINFGIIYGISAFGLGRQLGIPRSQAGAYIEAYFERYPGIRDYMERTKAEARAQGYVTTLFGRKCQGGRGGHHQARHGAAARCPSGRVLKRAHAAAGPRRAGLRGPRGGSGRYGGAGQKSDGIGGLPGGAAGAGYGRRGQLGRGALGKRTRRHRKNNGADDGAAGQVLHRLDPGRPAAAPSGPAPHGGHHPVPQKQRHNRGVDQRLAHVRLDHQIVVDDAADGDRVDQPVQLFPACRAEAPDHGVGRRGRQRKQKQERDPAHRDVPAYKDIGPDFLPVEELIQRDVVRGVQKGIREGEQPEHTAKAHRRGPARELAQGRHRQHDHNEAQRPVAREAVCGLDRIGAQPPNPGRPC